MIRLEKENPPADAIHISRCADIIINALQKLGLVAYGTIRYLRELNQQSPTKAIKEICHILSGLHPTIKLAKNRRKDFSS